MTTSSKILYLSPESDESIYDEPELGQQVRQETFSLDQTLAEFEGTSFEGISQVVHADQEDCFLVCQSFPSYSVVTLVNILENKLQPIKQITLRKRVYDLAVNSVDREVCALVKTKGMRGLYSNIIVFKIDDGLKYVKKYQRLPACIAL